MVRRRRRAKRRRTGYSETEIEQLLSGHDWSFAGPTFGSERNGTLDVEAMREAWHELRGELLPKWIAEHPGTRPHGWWRFDASERRRRIDGPAHPFDNPARDALVIQWGHSTRDAYRLWFGKPSSLIGLDDFGAVYETEVEFLERLGLLTNDERLALARDLPAT